MSEDAHVEAKSGLVTALPLADQLAVERTLMANERTLLAYIRTSLGLLAAALTLLKYFTSNGMHLLGYCMLPAGVGAFVIGFMNYHEMKLRVSELQQADLLAKKRAQSAGSDL